MKNKYLFGGGIIVVFLGIMIFLFTQTNVQYENNFSNIVKSDKTVKATGSWIKAKNYHIDKENNRFVFFMKDNLGKEMKVISRGTVPNNFESSTSVVVTGKYHEGSFYATDILTKCPSKYEEAPVQSAGS